MHSFEFVSTEDAQTELVLPFPSTGFTLGSAATCDVKLPGQAAPDLALRVDVSPTGEVQVSALHGALAVDGVATTASPVRLGQVVRLGTAGLLLRRLSTGPQTIRQRTGPTGIGHEKTATTSILAPGTVVAGRYEVVARLASGAMGDVYRVEHAALRKSFALKVLKPELSKDPEFVARFQREAIATTRIGQQNIIEVVDFGQLPAGQFYFVMEYLDGQTLASLVYRFGPMPAHRVLKLGLQIARALAASHEQGVVHRDVKPENVIVLERPGDPDFVKVLDFGVAKVTTTEPSGANQTGIGVIIGTPQYMAPEQCVGQPADARTDVYALGLILHELCTGRVVFQGEDASELMLHHTSTPAPVFGKGPLGDVPPELESLVLLMLEKRPAARPATMRQVIQALEDIEFSLDRPRRPSPRDEMPTSPLLPRVVLNTGAPAVVQRTTDELPAEPQLVVPKSRAPLFVLGGVAALVVWGVVALVFSGPKPVEPSPLPPPPAPVEVAKPAPPPLPLEAVKPPPAPEPARFTWHLTSRPTGALVTIDGAIAGKTPLDWTGAAESHTVKATLEGHRELSMPLTTDGGVVELVFKRAGSRASDIKDPFATPEANDLRDPFGDPP
ncbi:MAG: serine/threonine protein kinase [Archangium sp.]|nr:serine/threonine protein kinase [Archangium sp.]